MHPPPRTRDHLPTFAALAFAWLAPLAATAAGAQPPAHDHAALHGGSAPVSSPSLPGNDVFGAIQEVVLLLEADPGTDWSTVDVDALRAHLLDMEAVFGRARVSTEPIGGGARFRVEGEPDVLESARRMVPAHARAVQGLAGAGEAWKWAAREEGSSVILEVVGADAAAEQRIRGLGFFGLLASGAHHRQHHLAIARGGSPHRVGHPH